jgi:hypothetical protein
MSSKLAGRASDPLRLPPCRCRYKRAYAALPVPYLHELQSVPFNFKKKLIFWVCRLYSLNNLFQDAEGHYSIRDPVRGAMPRNQKLSHGPSHQQALQPWWRNRRGLQPVHPPELPRSCRGRAEILS